jgi:hypothetical protein
VDKILPDNPKVRQAFRTFYSGAIWSTPILARLTMKRSLLNARGNREPLSWPSAQSNLKDFFRLLNERIFGKEARRRKPLRLKIVPFPGCREVNYCITGVRYWLIELPPSTSFEVLKRAIQECWQETPWAQPEVDVGLLPYEAAMFLPVEKFVPAPTAFDEFFEAEASVGLGETA